jgi:3-deoxy-7-phosphoheptulonate synthase
MKTQDLRIIDYEKLISPSDLIKKIPLSNDEEKIIEKSRDTIKNIINKKDNRFLLIIGPCSIHDPDAALEYAYKLKQISDELSDKLFIVMRCYFQKPRTTIGWKGLINDPYLNNSFKINDGLYLARTLLRNITKIGLPIACELLDTITPQYFSDLISWGAIGARTTESQLHRELVSGVSFPCGFKNGTSGDIDIAVDAIISASYKHSFIGVTQNGNAAIVKTSGNKDCHIILRGGKKTTNYDIQNILNIDSLSKSKNIDIKIMIDCSHGNSNKNFENQVFVLDKIIENLKMTPNVIGIMIESNLKEGNQPLNDKCNLIYGKSITDGCIGWDTTLKLLYKLYNNLL